MPLYTLTWTYKVKENPRSCRRGRIAWTLALAHLHFQRSWRQTEAGGSRITRKSNNLYFTQQRCAVPNRAQNDVDSIYRPTPPPPTLSSNMSRSGHNNTLHALTPLTSSDSSPPGKLPSPRSAKPSHETMFANPTSSRPVLSSAPENGTDTITPVNTPPDTRPSIFPADGVLGQRLAYDPLLDPKLDKKARQSRTPKYTAILDKVCDGYT